MKLVIASNNQGKISEFKKIFARFGYKVISQRESGAEIEVEENADTFEGNAELKARALYEKLGCAVLADDSGLCVDCLDGAPGVYSARFGGGSLNDKEKNALLLEKMKDIPKEERGAQFVCALYYIAKDGRNCLAKGICRGEIAFEMSGENGFGYDSVFLYEGKSFAEHTAEFKNKNSHRARAIEKLIEELTRNKII